MRAVFLLKKFTFAISSPDEFLVYIVTYILAFIEPMSERIKLEKCVGKFPSELKITLSDLSGKVSWKNLK